MRTFFLIVLLAISTSIMAQQEPQSKTALLIIDIQEFYFVKGKSQLVNLISDTCAASNVAYGADTILAEDVHNSTLATIQSFYGKTMTTNEYSESSY